MKILNLKADKSRSLPYKNADGFQSENADVLTAVLNSVNRQTPSDLAVGLAEAAGRSTADDAGKIIVDRTEQMTPSMTAAAVRVPPSRPTTTTALLNAIETRAELGASRCLQTTEATAVT